MKFIRMNKDVISFEWGKTYKSIAFIFGRYWEKGTFKLFEFRRVPLGFDFNIWRFMISYDNWRKVKKGE